MSYRLILPLFVTIEPGDFIYVNMLVSRLESDLFGSCNALLVPFLVSFHILITFSYGSPSCMMHVYISLLPFQSILIITRVDLGGGLGSKLVYYVVHFTAITG